MREVTKQRQAAASGDAQAKWDRLEQFKPRLRQIARWVRGYFHDKHDFDATETTSLIHTCFQKLGELDAVSFETKMPSSAHMGKYACATMLNTVRDRLRKKIRELEAAREAARALHRDRDTSDAIAEQEATIHTVKKVLAIAEAHPVAFVATMAKAKGATFRQIAKELGYTPRTIERKRTVFLAAVAASLKHDE